jgi:hypothetical protein
MAEGNAAGCHRRIHTSIELDVPKDAISLTTGVYAWSTGQAGTQQIAISSIGQTATTPQPDSPATVSSAIFLGYLGGESNEDLYCRQ